MRVIALVRSGGSDTTDPILVAQIPLNGFTDPLLKGMGRSPTQLRGDLSIVYSVATIVPGTILRVGNQAIVFFNSCKIKRTISRFDFAQLLPTLYISPGRPFSRTVRIAEQWSDTWIQSRTCSPSP